MTFDELWRVNLDQERARGDSLEKADAVGRVAVSGENANELLLTADDCVFLSALGVRRTERNKEPRMRMMRLSKRLAFFEAWTICSEVRAYPKERKR